MTAGLGSGEETITSATHGLGQSLVYTSREQVNTALALICQLTLCEPEFKASNCCAVNENNGA